MIVQLQILRINDINSTALYDCTVALFLVPPQNHEIPLILSCFCLGKKVMFLLSKYPGVYTDILAGFRHRQTQKQKLSEYTT